MMKGTIGTLVTALVMLVGAAHAEDPGSRPAKP